MIKRKEERKKIGKKKKERKKLKKFFLKKKKSSGQLIGSMGRLEFRLTVRKQATTKTLTQEQFTWGHCRKRILVRTNLRWKGPKQGLNLKLVG